MMTASGHTKYLAYESMKCYSRGAKLLTFQALDAHSNLQKVQSRIEKMHLVKRKRERT